MSRTVARELEDFFFSPQLSLLLWEEKSQSLIPSKDCQYDNTSVSILLWKPSLCDVTEGTDTSYSEVKKGVLCPLRLVFDPFPDHAEGLSKH